MVITGMYRLYSSVTGGWCRSLHFVLLAVLIEELIERVGGRECQSEGVAGGDKGSTPRMREKLDDLFGRYKRIFIQYSYI